MVGEGDLERPMKLQAMHRIMQGDPDESGDYFDAAEWLKAAAEDDGILIAADDDDDEADNDSEIDSDDCFKAQGC